MGSEMCIRDSFSLRPKGQLRTPPAPSGAVKSSFWRFFAGILQARTAEAWCSERGHYRPERPNPGVPGRGHYRTERPRPVVPNGDITGPNGRTLVFPDGDITGQNGRGLVFTDEDITGGAAEAWCSLTGTLQAQIPSTASDGLAPSAFDPSLEYSTDNVVLFWQPRPNCRSGCLRFLSSTACHILARSSL